MIIEALILSTAAVVVASLGFADRVLKRQHEKDKPPSTSIDEQRLILERQRDKWIQSADKCSPYNNTNRNAYLDKAAQVDEQILKLTKEKP